MDGLVGWMMTTNSHPFAFMKAYVNERVCLGDLPSCHVVVSLLLSCHLDCPPSHVQNYTLLSIFIVIYKKNALSLITVGVGSK